MNWPYAKSAFVGAVHELPPRARSLQSQRGISLLELLLSVSIIGVILILATRYFYISSNHQKINHTTSEIASVVVALQNWDPGNADFSALGNTGILQLYKAGLLAESVDLQITLVDGVPSTAILYSAWNRSIMLSGEVGSATITLDFLKPSDCAAVSAAFRGSACNQTNQFSYVIHE